MIVLLLPQYLFYSINTITNTKCAASEIVDEIETLPGPAFTKSIDYKLSRNLSFSSFLGASKAQT